MTAHACCPSAALNEHLDNPRFRLYETHVRVQRFGRQAYPPSGTPRSTLLFFSCFRDLRSHAKLAFGSELWRTVVALAWFSPN
jgi:hypothetical protein